MSLLALMNEREHLVGFQNSFVELFIFKLAL